MDHKASILLVEDDLSLGYLLSDLLSTERYQVKLCRDGQAGLHYFKQHPVDLCILDIMMPEMDGFTLARHLRREKAAVPFLFLTAKLRKEDKLTGYALGAEDYLTKPFDEEELLTRIDNLLKNQEVRQQVAAAETDADAPAPPALSQPDREWLLGFEAYLRQHYTNDALTVSGLAYEFAMSESTLLRQLKRLTGLTPQQYLQEMRLDEARRLLENRVYNAVSPVAAKVGYADAGAFSRAFRARFGKLPSEMLGA